MYSGAQSAGPSAFRRLRRFAWGRPVSKSHVPGQACHTTFAACSPRYGFAVLSLAAVPSHLFRSSPVKESPCSQGAPFSPACGRWRFPFVPAMSWAVPAQAPEGVCLPHKLSVFAGGWEPKVSHPLYRQSPPGPHFQTPSGVVRQASCRPLVVGRLCPAQARRTRYSQPPTPLKFLTPTHHQEIHRHHPPDGERRDIKIYNRGQRQGRC